eukprot:Plantae.Rhodophyta-Purpureofilum_apyrenoidigerum.ctg12142.p1 GENE.Plantae.Rhodophyta-Purpureofilum_apyrenoidigerum.ctg12142~~Plantae.Rhodophyta-Purpureofilum_apyrenoidigerum.ctg12142.p1  ORF type:complete len:340 (+),score=60.79 Plantae.Rhodophyta-Purpureofilum_apyrenoidigerum.ctg12142:830-1849(+)
MYRQVVQRAGQLGRRSGLVVSRQWTMNGMWAIRRQMSTQSNNRIADIVDHVAKAHPLKDAIKYLETSDEKLLLWSNSAMKRHVDALSSGLQETGISTGDRIAVWMPLGSVEYAVTNLAAAKVGATIVAIDPPKHPENVDLATVEGALQKYKPKALFVWEDYSTGSGIQKGAASVIQALFPEAAEDSSLNATFTKLTGRKKRASQSAPFLEYVVHSGHNNIRGALTFKNLLVYDSMTYSPTVDKVEGKSEVFIRASSGKSLTQADILKEAESIAKKLGLSGDHTSKSGRLVLHTDPEADGKVLGALLAAMMKETLFISPFLDPDDQRIESAAEKENAQLV